MNRSQHKSHSLELKFIRKPVRPKKTDLLKFYLAIAKLLSKIPFYCNLTLSLFKLHLRNLFGSRCISVRAQ